MGISHAHEMGNSDAPDLRLQDDDLHVWYAGLDVPDAQLVDLAQTLSADESERARRFRFDRDIHRFIAGRGILRRVLSQYARIPAEELGFTYNKSGKPALPKAGFHFSLSHSHDLIAIGLRKVGLVGVDIERIRPITNLSGMMDFALSLAEREAIIALPLTHRLSAFYAFWTRKEALLKAIGEGIAGSFNPFDRTGCAKKVQVKMDGWCFHELPLNVGYIGTIVVDGAIGRTRHFSSSLTACR